MDTPDDLTPEELRHRVQALEAANRELQEANRRLARGWLGRADAAAASVLARYDAAARELREKDESQSKRIEELEAEVLQVGDQREEYRRALQRVERKKIVRLALMLDALRPYRRS
jgi:DNA repair exonuclease SbcCD ATPase subunit